MSLRRAGSARPRQLNRSLLRTSYVSGLLLHEQVADALARITVNGGRQGLVLVDIGCGRQPYRPLARHFGAQYVGVDTAQSVARGYAPPDTMVIKDNGLWPLGDCSADIIASTQAIEHIGDVYKHLGEARRVLKQDGWLLLSTHGHMPFHGEPDYWRWTHQGLERLLDTCGFRVEAMTPVLTSAANVLFVLCHLAHARLSAIPVLGLAFRALLVPANLLILALDRTGRKKVDAFSNMLLVLAREGRKK